MGNTPKTKNRKMCFKSQGHKVCKRILAELVKEVLLDPNIFRIDNDGDYYTINGPLSFCWMGIACCHAAAISEAMNTYDIMERDGMQP